MARANDGDRRMTQETKERVGVVVIGRNEGERLQRCLTSVMRDSAAVVYVDSGSTDNSIEMAQLLGAEVVQLDELQPFTAARSRNAGIARLQCLWPGTDCVQVIDGDCELVQGWIEAALEVMLANPKAAVVCGRRRERQPQTSIYNQL